MRNTIKGLLVVALMIGSVFAQYTKGNTVIAWSKYNEFRNMNEATEYSGNQGPLNQKTWPDKEERQAAVSAYSKYLDSYHEDVHLFENHVKLEKKKKKSKDNPNTVVAVTTSYWKPLSKVEGGSAEEREKMMQKYFKNITMKNDKILSQRWVTHLWSGSLSNGYYPITLITEFASMQDADDLETEPKMFNEVFKSDEDKLGLNNTTASNLFILLPG